MSYQHNVTAVVLRQIGDRPLPVERKGP